MNFQNLNVLLTLLNDMSVSFSNSVALLTMRHRPRAESCEYRVKLRLVSWWWLAGRMLMEMSSSLLRWTDITNHRCCHGNFLLFCSLKHNHIQDVYTAWRIAIRRVWRLPGRGVHPYLGMVGRFCSDDPIFFYLQSDWVPILYLNTIRLTPSFYRKIRLSLSHLVPEILGSNVGLIFHQNVLFIRFKAVCINSHQIFDPIDPLLHWF